MSQSKSNTNDEEIWNELFGDNSSTPSQKKGHHTIAPKKKDRDKKHPNKKRKIDKSSQNSNSHHHHHQNGHSLHSHHHHHHHQHQQQQHQQRARSSSQFSDGPSTAERLSQFLCTPKHRARLPPPPLKCKYLKYPHKKDRFTKYCSTNLELNYQWQMHHNSLFPLPLDLMDPDYYNPLKQADDYYDDDDTRLNRKEDERILNLLREREYKRTAKEDTSMPEQEAFLLQTQYLTGGQEYELTESQRKTYDQNSGSRRNKRKRRRYNDDEYFNNGGRGGRGGNDDDYDDNDDNDDEYFNNNSYSKRDNPHSVENVLKSFQDVQHIQSGYKHPRRPNVEVDKVFDVFPHDGLLELQYVHIQFDNNPVQHTKKCSFMPKYEKERLEMAQKCTENALLRCVNQKQLQRERRRNSKLENDDDDDLDLNDDNNNNNNNNDDDDNNLNNNNEPDWFSLYSTNGNKKLSKEQDEETFKYEWSAEFVPTGITNKRQFFLVIPKENNTENEEVFYAKYDQRISLRHRPTESSQDNMALVTGKKGLSEQDKKFFKQQPMNIKLNVPRSEHADSEDE